MADFRAYRHGTFMNNQAPPAIFWLLPILFPFFWYFVCRSLSQKSGWRALAEVYPARTPPDGKRETISGMMGKVRFSGCLYAHASRDGFYLSMMWLFSAGAEPLFIPWTDIHNQQTNKFLWQETVRFEIGQPCITTMELPKKVFDRLDAIRVR